MNNQPSHPGGVKTIDEVLHKLKTDAADARASCTERRNWEGYNGKYDKFENQAKAQLESIMQERLDQQHNELTSNETKVWTTREEFDKRMQDCAIEAAAGLVVQKESEMAILCYRAVKHRILMKDDVLSYVEDGLKRHTDKLKQLRTTNLTRKGVL